MIDKTLYCETFEKLRASDEAKMEVLNKMNEKRNRKSRCFRTAAAVGALCAMLAVSAGAVNEATGGMLLETLRAVWSNGYMTRYETTTGSGEQLTITAAEPAAVTVKDGRMLLEAGGETVDITDEIVQNGSYRFEKVIDGRTVVAEVTGTLEDWTLTETVTAGDGVTYETNTSSGDAADVQTGTVLVEESTDESGVEHVSTVTIPLTETE